MPRLPDNEHLPLPTLLSQALVAFTIELDNEFEHRMPHRTTSHGSTATPGPWLVSVVMWSNCLRFVGDDGLTVRELENLAHTRTNLDGMRRWGYITIEPGPAGLIRPTRFGRLARETWPPLFELIETRWQERFGAARIARLRAALASTDAALDGDLADCLPILGHGLFSRGPQPEGAPAARVADGSSERSLLALLSRVLLAFAGEFEQRSKLSLAISANMLEALDERAVPVRELPRRTGVSKEAISMALGILQPKGLAVVEPDPGGSRRFKVARLTSKGREGRDASARLLAEVEARWNARELRESLEPLVGASPAESPLWRGLEPYPDGWRASVRSPDTLPHFPMVLHRGGFPDGS